MSPGGPIEKNRRACAPYVQASRNEMGGPDLCGRVMPLGPHDANSCGRGSPAPLWDKEARALALSIRCIPATLHGMPVFNQGAQNERWQESGPVVRRVLSLPAVNPPPGQGRSKSAGQRRRHRAA
jgi:hypothetical protein